MKCDWCPPKTHAKFPACFQRYSGSCTSKNPGNIQELHRLAKRIEPKFFDGLELDYTHRLTANKAFTANWVLSHIRPSGFRIGGIYTLQLSDDMMQTPTIQADINPSTWSSNFKFTYYPFNCLRFDTRLQRANKDAPLLTETTIELCRPCATFTAKLYNVSSDSGRATLSFMRGITSQWALGAELLLEWTQPKQVMADTAVAARYSNYGYSVAASASRHGFDLSFWQRLHDNIQMASTLAWQRKTEKAIATICYQWRFEDAVVRGMFDSDLWVGFSYNRAISHMPCEVGLSVQMSLPTNRFTIGMKVNLDPSALQHDEA